MACFLLASLRCAWGAPPPSIRVLVEEGERFTIHGLTGELRLHSGDDEKAPKITLEPTITVRAGEQGIFINDRLIGRSCTISNPSQMYRIGERFFGGILSLEWESEKRLFIVDHLPLEDYLVGLVGSEVFPDWPLEALKAQAVAARTYALARSSASSKSPSQKIYDVTSTVLSQVYEGTHREHDRARQAVQKTSGMVLTRHGEIFPAYYHSCCGGMTEHAENVWEGAVGPPQIHDPYCKDSPRYRWQWEIGQESFQRALQKHGIRIGRIKGLAMKAQHNSPRVDQLIITHADGRTAFKATELRRIFGYGEIKSTWFTATLKGDTIVLTGHGFGHGVGMCQWGSKTMAAAGKTFEQILAFYYPDAKLLKVY